MSNENDDKRTRVKGSIVAKYRIQAQRSPMGHCQLYWAFEFFLSKAFELRKLCPYQMISIMAQRKNDKIIPLWSTDMQHTKPTKSMCHKETF